MSTFSALRADDINALLKVLVDERESLAKQPKPVTLKEQKTKAMSLMFYDGKISALKDVLNPTETTLSIVKEGQRRIHPEQQTYYYISCKKCATLYLITEEVYMYVEDYLNHHSSLRNKRKLLSTITGDRCGTSSETVMFLESGTFIPTKFGWREYKSVDKKSVCITQLSQFLTQTKATQAIDSL